MTTTILEIAKHAGVSEATVSHMLLGNGYISQETKDRMFQTVEESGYRPSLLACNLSTKSTQMLGLVVANTLYHGIYFSELLFHAARMAEKEGRQLLLVDSKHSAEEERQTIQYLLDLRCGAIMIYPRFLNMDEIDDIIDAHSQPVIVLSRRLCKDSSHSVWCDHKQTSFNAVAGLIAAGYQEIAFLIGSMDSPASIERLAGYRDALAQHGTAFNEKLITNDKWTPASGTEGVETLLERGAKFSALVASNGDMAIGAIKALRGHGIVMSEQVLVIGFDDIAIAPYIVPTLSSVKISVIEMIQEIIGWLIFVFDGGGFSPPKIFGGKLICHGSLIALLR